MPHTEYVQIDFRGCFVRVYPAEKYLVTIFPDGRQVEACPHDTPEYKTAARDHGYEDVWEYCLHHELLHTINAEVNGLLVSETLRAVSEDRAGSSDEEAQIMNIQRIVMRLREYEDQIREVLSLSASIGPA